MSITLRDILKPVPKFQDVDDAAMRQCFNDRNTQRDVKFFIRHRHPKSFIGRGGCNLYECHATLLNCNQCLFRFKCFTERVMILEAKEDAGLIYLRDKWGMLWQDQSLSFGCGGAKVVEKEGFDCDACDEGCWGACEAEKNT